MWALWILSGIGYAYIVVYTANLLLPESCRWLSSDDMAAIKDTATAIVSGVAMSLGMKFFSK